MWLLDPNVYKRLQLKWILAPLVLDIGLAITTAFLIGKMMGELLFAVRYRPDVIVSTLVHWLVMGLTALAYLMLSPNPRLIHMLDEVTCMLRLDLAVVILAAGAVLCLFIEHCSVHGLGGAHWLVYPLLLWLWLKNSESKCAGLLTGIPMLYLVSVIYETPILIYCRTPLTYVELTSFLILLNAVVKGYIFVDARPRRVVLALACLGIANLLTLLLLLRTPGCALFTADVLTGLRLSYLMNALALAVSKLLTLAGLALVFKPCVITLVDQHPVAR